MLIDGVFALCVHEHTPIMDKFTPREAGVYSSGDEGFCNFSGFSRAEADSREGEREDKNKASVSRGFQSHSDSSRYV